MANFTCLASARNAVLKRSGWDVEARGIYGAPRVNVVVNAERHITIDMSMRLLGFGTDALLAVDTDAQGRMKPEALRQMLLNLTGPTIICAQAGNVNTGAFDPLREIGELANRADAWLHVDAAFGLWAAVSPTRRQLLDGVELANSWAVDAHKWLNVPYDCGMAIVRDADAQRSAMSSTAPYVYRAGGPDRDNVDWVPEFSRRARAVPVYAALRTLGRSGLEEMIDRCCDQAAMMADLLRRDSRAKLLNDVVLNQVLVRFGDSDDETRAVIERVQKEGTCWLGGTTWHGQAAMRISFSNWATSEEDVRRSAEAILRCIQAS